MNDRPNPSRVAHDYLLRLADTAPSFAVEEDSASEAERLFSGRARRLLYKAFGPRGMPFFNLYPTLYRGFAGGNPPPEGYKKLFWEYARILYRMLDTEVARNQFSEFMARVRPLLGRLDNDQDTTTLWREVAEAFGGMINAALRDQGIFLKTKRLPGTGGVPWLMFLMMTKDEQYLERVKEDDPELYARLLESKELRKEIDEQIIERVESAGLEPGRMSFRGRALVTGTDPVTKERFVYDDDGSRLTVDEFITKLDAKNEEQKKLRKVSVTDTQLADLRRVPDELIDQVMAERPPEYVALTDDPTKHTSLTRIYPVVELFGEKFVASGRFKGIAVPDLVNRAGKQIEGSVYDYDEKLKRPVRRETRNRDGSPNLQNMKEPYATTDRGKLLVHVPKDNSYAPIRNALKKLVNLIPTLELIPIPGTRAFNVRFEAKDFTSIRDAIGGMALSNAAMKQVKAYFDRLAKNEKATAKENLGYYEAEALGGFGYDVTLSTKQKEALAWLDANGNKGVCALDTGMGKTLAGIAIMQKLKRDGLMEEPGSNGRYLYVCPKALTGNLKKEMEKFLVEPDLLYDKTDVLSYPQFLKAMRADKNFAKPYVAVFFDEAQALKNPEGKTSIAAQKCNHPRKIMLTASPMERSPMEVYTLTAITNNVDLTTRKAREERRQFKRRFAESVGGRVVGIRQDDPATLRDFQTWVKSNIYFAAKTDPDAGELPDLKRDTLAINMPPEIEAQYKAVTKSFTTRLKAAMHKFRKDPRSRALAIESLKVSIGKELSELNRLTNIPNWTYEDIPNPTLKNPKGTKRVWTRNPDEANPKVAQAVDIVKQRTTDGAKVILFTDSPQMAEESVIQNSEQSPGLKHVVGYADRIEVWRNGELMPCPKSGKGVDAIDLPACGVYRERRYRDEAGEWTSKREWAVFVLQKIIKQDPEVATSTLTGSYAVGQNLQEFSTVIHLDRDTWNAETMKQRTARAWRQGQESTVEEITLDMVFDDDTSKGDQTLDEIRGVMQEMDAELFDDVILDSQEVELGKEWLDMKKSESALHEIDRRLVEQAMSPYVSRMGEEER